MRSDKELEKDQMKERAEHMCKKMKKEDLLLYAVTDRHWLNGETLYSQVEKTLEGGTTFVQLREKELDEAHFLKEAKEIKELCARYRVPFASAMRSVTGGKSSTCAASFSTSTTLVTFLARFAPTYSRIISKISQRRGMGSTILPFSLHGFPAPFRRRFPALLLRVIAGYPMQTVMRFSRFVADLAIKNRHTTT